MSDVLVQELSARKHEIEKEIELLFKANLKITDWDVPEADDEKAAEIILRVMEKKIHALQADVKAGKYTNY